jgi:hypothetical protein
MGFRKPVAAETLQLPESAFGKFTRVAIIQHAGDQLVLECVDAAGRLERRHRAAELVGFGRREAGSHHGDLHGLFLKRHAKRLAEHFFKRRI